MLRTALLMVGLVAAAPSAAQEPFIGRQVQVGAGVPSVLDEGPEPTAFVEMRWAPGVLALRPSAGVMGGARGQVFVFGGLARDLRAGPLVLTPALSAGAYQPGRARDLGSPVEFRSSVSLGWEFTGGVRAGVHLSHTSNAGLGVRNPGHDGVALLLALPF